MASYSIAEAKDKFSRLIEAANEGEPVVVTRHGKPVARIMPMQEDRLAARRKALDELLEGILPHRPGAPDSVELLRQMYEDDDYHAHRESD